MNNLHLDISQVPVLYRIKVTVDGDPYEEATSYLLPSEVEDTRLKIYSMVVDMEPTRSVSVDIFPA